MKKLIFTALTLAFTAVVSAQNYTDPVWATFEEGDPIAFGNIEYEGGATFAVANNPSTSGINKSAKCLSLSTTDQHEWWHKLKLKTAEGTSIKPNKSANVFFHFKSMRTRLGEGSEIWIFDATENENSPILKVAFQNTKAGVWEDFVFEIAADQIDRDIAAIRIMPELNFNNNVTAAEYYFDDFQLIESSYPDGVDLLENVTKIFDFDDESLTEKYIQEFAVQAPGAAYSVVANPKSTTVNPSAKVIRYNKPANQTWWHSLRTYINGMIDVKYPNTYLHVMAYNPQAKNVTMIAKDHLGKEAKQVLYLYSSTQWEDLVLDISELSTIREVIFRFDAAEEADTDYAGAFYLDDLVLDDNYQQRSTITPSGIEDESADGFDVYAKDGQIVVEGLGLRSVEVYTLTGAKIAQNLTSTDGATFELPKSTYIVKANLNGAVKSRLVIN